MEDKVTEQTTLERLIEYNLLPGLLKDNYLRPLLSIVGGETVYYEDLVELYGENFDIGSLRDDKSVYVRREKSETIYNYPIEIEDSATYEEIAERIKESDKPVYITFASSTNAWEYTWQKRHSLYDNLLKYGIYRTNKGYIYSPSKARVVQRKKDNASEFCDIYGSIKYSSLGYVRDALATFITKGTNIESWRFCYAVYVPYGTRGRLRAIYEIKGMLKFMKVHKIRGWKRLPNIKKLRKGLPVTIKREKDELAKEQLIEIQQLLEGK